MILTHNFYNRPVVEVAKDLLGKRLAFGSVQGIITETEAYGGSDDEASHAYRGITKRSAIMFGSPGYTYVYMIYGMYYCLNIVAEEEENPGAVLIRALMLPQIDLNGPGKVCRYLGITKNHNGIDLIHSDCLFVTHGIPVLGYTATSRIGINKALDKQWRFVMNRPVA